MAVMLASELEAAEAAQRQLAVRCEAQAAEIGEIGLQAEELRAARLEVANSLETPVSAFCAPDEIPTYELESPRAGPLQRLVR